MRNRLFQDEEMITASRIDFSILIKNNQRFAVGYFFGRKPLLYSSPDRSGNPFLRKQKRLQRRAGGSVGRAENLVLLKQELVNGHAVETYGGFQRYI